MSKFRKQILSVLLIAAMLFSAVFPGGIFVKAESANTLSDGSLIYQMEEYYTGNISEGAAADLQPNECIEIALGTNEGFVAGKYTLLIRSCGNRESFEILINDESVGTISRTGTGFGMDQMTEDKLGIVLELGAGDIVTVVAPAGAYGWVDYLQLDPYTEPGSANEFVYQAENYYTGSISEGTAADLQPNERIEIALGTNNAFTAGKYTLLIRSCGNRESFEILVNGESVGSIIRTGTDFGMDQMTEDKLSGKILQLKPEDIITIVAPAEGYGWMDYLYLEAYDISDGVESGPDYFTYQGEAFYELLPGDGSTAADIQPEETMVIPLNTNADFSGGKYTLSISSCGNRESFEILINGESVGSISRSGTGFGMDQMTVDKLDVVLELYADDIVTVVASADGYGWVDYLQLDKYISADATESGDGYFVYQMEYFYDGNICEDIAADLQPGESILFRLNTNQDFTAGRYRLTVYSCGNRESFDILVNGEYAGTVNRVGTGYGQNQMTYDKLSTILELEPEDVITVVAPTEGYGWVDFVVLDLNVVAQVYQDGVAGETFLDLQAAVDAAVSVGGDLKLLADSPEEITVSGPLNLDLNGHNLTGKVTITDGAVLYGIDTTTDDYDCSDGYGSIAQLEGAYEPFFLSADSKYYAAITDENGKVSFHRFYMAINNKLLRPESNGAGFKAIYAGDEVIKNNLDSFGIQVCVGDDFTTNPVIRTGDFIEFTAGMTTNIPNQKTVVIKNILKAENGYDNAAAAVACIHGKPYMIIDGHKIIAQDTVTTSLRELINSANDSDGTPGSVLMAIYNQFVAPFGDVMNDDTWHTDRIWEVGSEGAGVITDIYTDKASYSPGDRASLTVELLAEEDLNAALQINVTQLTNVIYTTTIPIVLTTEKPDSKTVRFNLPDDDFQGYSVEVYLIRGEKRLDWEMTAVEAASDWSMFPRYGYLTRYSAEVDAQSTLERLNKFHINGLFYYDVIDRHEKPLAGTVESPAESWNTLANHEATKNIVSNLINIGHSYNMNSYMYNLIFGAYEDYAQSGVDQDWGLFEDFARTKQAYHGPLSENWETQKLYLFNPGNVNWQNHYLRVTDDMLKVYDFDGIQVDSLGDRGTLYTKGGQIFGTDLSEQYSPLLNRLTQELGTKVIFNPVSGYGLSEVMSTVDYDIAYEEIWPFAAKSYSDLKAEVDNIRSLMTTENGSQKGIVIAAYMNYDVEKGKPFNVPGVLLANATLMASGAAHLELGDTGMLSHEYYPGTTLVIDDVMDAKLRNYYSFMVAYENYLRDPALIACDAATYINGTAAERDSVVGQIWSFSKKSENAGQVIHFINLCGTSSADWADSDGTQAEPTKQENLTVRQYVDAIPQHVYLASPDHADGIMTELPFETGMDANGTYITFQMPQLHYWNMVILK